MGKEITLNFLRCLIISVLLVGCGGVGVNSGASALSGDSFPADEATNSGNTNEEGNYLQSLVGIIWQKLDQCDQMNLTFEEFNAGILQVNNIDTEIGVLDTYPKFGDIVDAEKHNAVVAGTPSDVECSDALRNLSCSSLNVTESYDVNEPDRFDHVYHIFPQACAAVYSSQSSPGNTD